MMAVEGVVHDQGSDISELRGSWTVDAAHSLVEFSVRHMGIARVRGHFEVFDGVVSVGAGERPDVAVDVRIGVDSVASGHPKRDELVRSEEFLGAARYPVMEFHARTAVPSRIDGDFHLPGELTLKGITGDVVLQVTGGGVVTHRGATRAGFSARTHIDRSQYAVDFGASLANGRAIVSHGVDIVLEIELVKTQ